MTRGVWDTEWRYVGADYLGRQVSVTVAYSPTTLAIVNPGLSGTRDAGCLFDQVIVGRNGTVRTFAIPEGSFSVNRNLLRQNGFEDIATLSEASITLSASGG